MNKEAEGEQDDRISGFIERNRPELIDAWLVTVRELERIGVTPFLGAGMAVTLFTDARIPTDVDLSVYDSDLERIGASNLYGQPQKITKHQGDMTMTMKACLSREGVEIVGSIEVITDDGPQYNWELPADAVDSAHQIKVRGQEVLVLLPEEIALLKALFQRGPELGKHDGEDILALHEAIEEFGGLNADYLKTRAEEMKATERIIPYLKRLGVLKDGE